MKVLLKPLKGEQKQDKLELKLDVEVTSHHKYLVNKYQLNNRFFNSSSKNRSAVRGGGAKPYRQKGTGNARRGTNRTPLRRGGGVIFGPTPRNVTVKVSNKLIKTVTKSLILKHKELLVINSEGFDKAKTNEVKKIYCPFNDKQYVLVLSENDYLIYKAFSNIRNITVMSVKNMMVGLLIEKYELLFSESAFNYMQEWFKS